MSELRIATVLAVSAVFYFVADLRARGSRFSTLDFVLLGFSLLLAFGPRFVRLAARTGEAGARAVAWLGPVLALALVTRLPERQSMADFVAHAFATVVWGLLVFDLAIHVPEFPRPLAKLRAAAISAGVVVFALTVLGAMSARGLPVGVRVAPSLARLPEGYVVSVLGAALVVRLARTRLVALPAALAANAWAVLGLVPALAASAVAFLPDHLSALSALPTGVHALPTTFAAASLLYGHVAMVDPGRRLEVASVTRLALVWTVAGLVPAGLGALAAYRLHLDPLTNALVAVGGLALASVVARLVAPLVRRLVAPFGGRLLDAVEHGIEAVPRAATLEQLAADVLGALREASSDAGAEPRLVVTDPSLVLEIDAAGLARSRKEEPSPALLERLVASGDPVSFADLDANVVRRPELRPLHEALVQLDALCVVPLWHESHLEGFFVVPRGARRTAPTIEELDRLDGLARAMSPLVALFSAQRRAEGRVSRLAFERDRAEELAESARDEATRLRTEVRALRSARGASGIGVTVVAYSAAGRDLEAALAEVAPTLAAATLVAEPGSHVDRIAQRVHAASGVSDGPFVLVDCATLREADAEVAFFGLEGDASAPGFLRLADHGTLFLADPAALPMPLQRSLAEALSARGARSVGSHAIYGFDVRLLAASRVPVELLVSRGALDEELGRRFSQVQIRVPPLRERREDLSSLSLIALDRAARRLGMPPMGLDADAMEALLAYDFPGNLRELESVLDRAASFTEGQLVTGATLSSVLAGSSPAEPAPLDGTLVEIERRALRRALARASGNKSEAARLLGVARTTFLDKWRRFGLEEGPLSIPPGAPDAPRDSDAPEK